MTLIGFEKNPMISINRRAKQILFRLDRVHGRPLIVLPSKSYLKKIDHYRDVYNQRVKKINVMEPVSFKSGIVFPYRGDPHTLEVIRIQRGERNAIEIRESHPQSEARNTFVIHSRRDDIHLDIKRFFMKEALRVAEELSQAHAEKLGVSIKDITIKDLRSLWGRCLRQYELCYNWRLILAPHAVFDYLCAHEVSHCLHSGHGLKFWSTVASLCPDHKNQRRWLREHGQALMRYSLKWTPNDVEDESIPLRS